MLIFICDDEVPIIKKYAELIKKIGHEHSINIRIKGCISGEQLLFELSEDLNRADVVYMDIDFGSKLDGIATADKLRKKGYDKEIVFLTKGKERVFDAFDPEPLNYIVKDETSMQKFEKILLKAYEKIKAKNREFISISCAGESRNIPLDDIFYFEVSSRLIAVHYGEGEIFEFYSTIGKIENLLFNKGFIRTHRAFLVSVSKIATVSGNEVTLLCGDVIPIGRTYLKAVRNYLTEQQGL